jgi:hypothetical protein
VFHPSDFSVSLTNYPLISAPYGRRPEPKVTGFSIDSRRIERRRDAFR